MITYGDKKQKLLRHWEAENEKLKARIHDLEKSQLIITKERKEKIANRLNMLVWGLQDLEVIEVDTPVFFFPGRLGEK